MYFKYRTEIGEKKQNQAKSIFGQVVDSSLRP